MQFKQWLENQYPNIARSSYFDEKQEAWNWIVHTNFPGGNDSILGKSLIYSVNVMGRKVEFRCDKVENFVSATIDFAWEKTPDTISNKDRNSSYNSQLNLKSSQTLQKGSTDFMRLLYDKYILPLKHYQIPVNIRASDSEHKTGDYSRREKFYSKGMARAGYKEYPDPDNTYIGKWYMPN